MAKAKKIPPEELSPAELKARKKKRMATALIVMCAIALVGLVFLNMDISMDDIFGEREIVQHVYDGDGVHRISLWDPDWDTDIFELPRYLDKNRLLTYAENGMAISMDSDFSDYGEPIQLFADYFSALQHGDAEAVCAFYADSYFETHDRWEKITMQKIYDMRVEYLKNADAKSDGKTVTNWYYKVTYKIMENDGTFRNDLISDAERAQYYVITDDGYSLKITDVSYAYQGNK
ncbi:MAG: hypothetical protein E7632_14155 [Ruminococcaceae bacterium]|nr:hypothetical protein [Oscillospiraceae bacterium]